MKIKHRNLLFCLVPLIAPLTASAESGQQAERAPSTSQTRNNAGRSTSETRDNAASSTTETRRNDTSSTSGSWNKDASWRVSEIMGVDVKNAGDESIGEVEDIVLDMKNGEVLAVVISSGGFLGIGESLSAVPASALSYNATEQTLSTRLTKEQLEDAPQFKNDAWPDYNEAGAQETLRSFSNSIDGDVNTRDNTTQTNRENRRDAATQVQTDREMRRDATSRMEQGKSDEDVKITRDIRSYISDTELSRNAKNIDIITRDEHVTLKGMVDTEAEHEAIIKIAEIHVDRSSISDELVVTSK